MAQNQLYSVDIFLIIILVLLKGKVQPKMKIVTSLFTHAVLPDWAVLNLIVRVNIGLGGWTKFGLIFGQSGGFQNI